MMKIRTAALVTTIGLGGAAIALTGCASGSTKSGTSYKYEFNTLTATISASLDDTYRAAESALKFYELTIEEAKKDAFEGRIVAKGADNKKHTVTLTKTGDKQTRVGVSVGAFGDQERSREIMSRIEEEAS